MQENPGGHGQASATDEPRPSPSQSPSRISRWLSTLCGVIRTSSSAQIRRQEHPDRVFSISRGGASNIRSPSSNPNSRAANNPPQDSAVYSSGGGTGNVNRSPSRDREFSTSHGRGRDSVSGQIELMNPQIEASQPLVAFQSLINRSIAAWQAINYVGPERGEERIAAINVIAGRLRSLHSFEEVLSRRGFWFFQLRESFMRQKVLLKWDPTRLDEYILLPIIYGFVNKRDCFFVSHYWLTTEHPDPQAVDLVQIQQDLKDEEWSYVWVDWTCVPQLPRTEPQQVYFNRMLQYIKILVRDCGFAWRFPAFEPRGWILHEVAEYVLNQKNYTVTDDIRPFIHHITQMITDGVQPVIEKYGYKCTKQGDFNLVVGWLELSVLLFKLLHNDVMARRRICDSLNEPFVGSVTDYDTGINIDKANGVILYKGKTHRFTPVFHLTSHT